jgi:hypothetical protein
LLFDKEKLNLSAQNRDFFTVIWGYASILIRHNHQPRRSGRGWWFYHIFIMLSVSDRTLGGTLDFDFYEPASLW